MSHQIRFTKVAREDLKQLYRFFINQNIHVANQALVAINRAIALLECSPFTCRRVKPDNPFLRELLISFSGNGYVAQLEIEENKVVTILAVRHQREDDFY